MFRIDSSRYRSLNSQPRIWSLSIGVCELYTQYITIFISRVLAKCSVLVLVLVLLEARVLIARDIAADLLNTFGDFLAKYRNGFNQFLDVSVMVKMPVPCNIIETFLTIATILTK